MDYHKTDTEWKKDEKSFELYFKSNYQRFCSYAYTFLKDQDDAEDIVQQIFIAMWEKRDTLNIETSATAYMMRAIRNASLNRLKHAEVKQSYVNEKGNEQLSGNQVTSVVVNELQAQIAKAIDALPQQCRIIFSMSRFEELTYSEIATKLNLSVKTVENQMGKALRLMRERLKDYLLLIIILGAVL
ncbi:MAG TPA: RNA polymerase sigma-70 factor [Bacteroidia bacterium]|nr:RNA polymerase sigma-70 factor [Bacteroidota bacterium]MCB8930610.1 RNA polymerase sigma-70 factor [Bacteroidia bacterium]MCC7513853.1 RNA polymerase sigma-70 factor [Bacteroidia bacterium]MCW5930527.1 RNA polymerase sigma-70 factor [Bacteroidota bacterium]HNR47611.1 RNA polymerase sigma-70 factor [Bacteroidia bacterium]